MGDHAATWQNTREKFAIYHWIYLFLFSQYIQRLVEVVQYCASSKIIADFGKLKRKTNWKVLLSWLFWPELKRTLRQANANTRLFTFHLNNLLTARVPIGHDIILHEYLWNRCSGYVIDVMNINQPLAKPMELRSRANHVTGPRLHLLWQERHNKLLNGRWPERERIALTRHCRGYFICTLDRRGREKKPCLSISRCLGGYGAKSSLFALYRFSRHGWGCKQNRMWAFC